MIRIDVTAVSQLALGGACVAASYLSIEQSLWFAGGFLALAALLSLAASAR